MTHRVRKLCRLAMVLKCAADTSGVTAIEYALIGSIVVIAVTALVNGIGVSVSNMLTSVAAGL